MVPRFNPTRYMALLDFFAIDHKKKARALSQTQRSKLEIAIGMSRGADFILMDEPLPGTDLFTRQDFFTHMLTLLQPHEGVLIATHHIEAIESFITRAVVMGNGRVVASKSMENINNLTDFVQPPLIPGPSAE